MVPWELISTHPSSFVLVPFVWLVWQIYLPRLINRLIGKSPSDDFVYSTWLTSTKRELKNEIIGIDERVDKMGQSMEYIADTQDRLVNITIAQSKMMNGHDGEISVEDVEDDLRDDTDRTYPSDYLKDHPDDRDDSEYRDRGDA